MRVEKEAKGEGRRKGKPTSEERRERSCGTQALKSRVLITCAVKEEREEERFSFPARSLSFSSQTRTKKRKTRPSRRSNSLPQILQPTHPDNLLPPIANLLPLISPTRSPLPTQPTHTPHQRPPTPTHMPLQRRRRRLFRHLGRHLLVFFGQGRVGDGCSGGVTGLIA